MGLRMTTLQYRSADRDRDQTADLTRSTVKETYMPPSSLCRNQDVRSIGAHWPGGGER